MRIVFSRLARQELDDAVRYYELQRPRLGARFKEEAKKAALRITDYPEAWSIERGEVRKCLLHNFPYKLLYSVEEDHIFIVAVAHLHRQPDYWVGRDEA
jgi:plasmid stabilization system protein ParE